MKPPFRPVRNFFHSNSGTLCPHKYILKGTLFRGISHLTDATFKTTSSSNVVEQFLLRSQWQQQSRHTSSLVASYTFTLACCSLSVIYKLQLERSQLRFNLKAPLNKSPLRVRSNFFRSKQGAFANRNYFFN